MNNIASNALGLKQAVKRDAKRRCPNICSGCNKFYSQLVILVKSQAPNFLKRYKEGNITLTKKDFLVKHKNPNGVQDEI
jgi:hypothetical protein